MILAHCRGTPAVELAPSFRVDQFVLFRIQLRQDLILKPILARRTLQFRFIDMALEKLEQLLGHNVVVAFTKAVPVESIPLVAVLIVGDVAPNRRIVSVGEPRKERDCRFLV